MASNAKWFVVHTYSGYENKVVTNIKIVVENRGLQDEILDVVVPTTKIKEIKNGKETEIERKLFPGYVFVKVKTSNKYEHIGSNKPVTEEELGDRINSGEYRKVIAMDDEAWYVIRNTRGVTGFVGPDSKPQPLSDKELKDLGFEVEKEEKKSIDDEFADDDFFDEMDDISDYKIEVDYEVGDSVEIIGDQFNGYTGVVKAIDLEKEIVTVNISMFGRDTPSEFGLDEVKLIK